ncbi:hypothetical protein [Aeromicrobium sp. Leaf245]|uniref:hypothetical protein n=1 Tax=Aeromicrobium sp. Leaf245 TaxID=1736306 RepID=UPI000B2AD3BA|nr:hypothetical protein [Aeromicrobium sp. Leaf245]
MENGEQALRLLIELQRHDLEASDDSEHSGVASASLLAALIETEFDLPAAILGIARGA